MIDLLSVFPFYLFLDRGVTTRLFRLFRMPRLLKLLDVNKFKAMLRSFAAGKTDIKSFIQ